MSNLHYCQKNTMEKAASRARGDRLHFMYRICGKQKTISTRKLLLLLEQLHESDKLDAIHFRDLVLYAQKLEQEVNQLRKQDERDADAIEKASLTLGLYGIHVDGVRYVSVSDMKEYANQLRQQVEVQK